jgi:hypothetical protein
LLTERPRPARRRRRGRSGRPSSGGARVGAVHAQARDGPASLDPRRGAGRAARRGEPMPHCRSGARSGRCRSLSGWPPAQPGRAPPLRRRPRVPSPREPERGLVGPPSAAPSGSPLQANSSAPSGSPLQANSSAPSALLVALPARRSQWPEPLRTFPLAVTGPETDDVSARLSVAAHRRPRAGGTGDPPTLRVSGLVEAVCDWGALAARGESHRVRVLDFVAATLAW